MTQVLKMLTRAALATLVMVTAVANLSSIAPKIPQELISTAKVFALFTVILLAVGLIVPFAILRHRTAMIMGNHQRFMLRTLSELAVLAAGIALHRLLPYLTCVPRGNGEDRSFVTAIAIVLPLGWLLAPPRGRAWGPIVVEMAAAHGPHERRGWRNRALEKLMNSALATMVVTASYILPVLTEDGRGLVTSCRLFVLFAAFVLASGVLLVLTVVLRDQAV